MCQFFYFFRPLEHFVVLSIILSVFSNPDALAALEFHTWRQGGKQARAVSGAQNLE